MSWKFRQKIMLNGGINLNADPRVLGDNELTRAQNMYPNVSGVMEKRVPCVPITCFPDGVHERALIWATVPDRATTIDLVTARLLQVSGENGIQLQAWRGLNFDTTTNDAIWTQTIIGPTEAPSVVHYNGETFFMFGHPTEGFYVLGLNGFRHESFTLVIDDDPDFVQVQTAPVSPKIAGVYNRRVVWANLAPGMGNTIVIADRDYAPLNFKEHDHTIAVVIGDDVLSTFSRSFSITHLAGDEITAIQEVALSDTSNPLQIALLVLGKQRGVYLTGESLQSTDTPPSNGSYYGTLQPNNINYDCGCFGPEAICTTPEGVFWAGQDNIWFLARGAQPQAVGNNLRPLLSGIAPADHNKVQLKYFDKRLVLGVPGATEVEPDVAAFPYASARAVLEFYWFDIKWGLQNARWYGPMTYGPELRDDYSGGFMGLAVQNYVGQSQLCYGVGYHCNSSGNELEGFIVNLIPDTAGNDYRDRVIGDAMDPAFRPAPPWLPNTDYNLDDYVRPVFMRTEDGVAYKCVTAGTSGPSEPEFDGGTGVADGSCVWDIVPIDAPGDYNADNAVAGKIVTKAFDFGEGTRRKTLKKVYAELFTGEAQRVYCRDILNLGNSTKTMQTILGHATNNELGHASFDAIPLGADFSHRAFTPTNSELITSEHHQLSFEDDAGIVIDATNDTIAASLGIAITDDGTLYLAGYWEITVPRGVYASIDALGGAVANALNIGLNEVPTSVLLPSGGSISSINWEYVGVAGTGTGRPAFLASYIASGVMGEGYGVCFLFAQPNTLYETAGKSGSDPIFTPFSPQPTVAWEKCRRLLSLFGFSTNIYVSDMPLWDLTGTSGQFLSNSVPNDQLAAPRFMASSLKVFYSDMIVPFRKSVNFAMTDADATGVVLGGEPFTKRDR